MVLAFLRAERHSSRYGNAVERAFRDRPQLLDAPNLNDEENDIRREALWYRGYGTNEALFTGFPDDVEWWLVSLTRAEVADLYLGAGQWHDLTEGTRRVAAVASNYERIVLEDDPRVNEAIRAIVTADRAGGTFEPIVIVSTSPEGPHVLIEGYARASAYAATPDGPDVEALVGYSPHMSSWEFWRLV
jgi:hypothetical protein